MLDKRVKRHVKARSHEFFAVTTPGLEDVCEAEIRCLGLDDVRPKAVPGGVVFSGKLPDLYTANLCLSTASRILMRIDSFEARDFPRLEKKIAEIPWELYLPADGQVSFKVSSHSSRLYHKDAVAQRIYGAISERMAGLKVVMAEDAEIDSDESGEAADAPVQAVFARVYEDRFTVSLDSSGELLHRRGYHSLSGRAPLRETLAAAILRLAGYDGSMPLFDPLCGSGNFATEAAFIAKNLPCGMNREFTFSRWPAFSAPTFEHIKKARLEQSTTFEAPQIISTDRDQKVLESLSGRLSGLGLDDAVFVGRADFLSLDPRRFTDEKGVVVLNPPYGKRMGTVESARTFLAEAGERLGKLWAGFGLGIITPHEDILAKMPWTHGLSVKHVFHGGLKVAVIFGRIPERNLREVRF